MRCPLALLFLATLSLSALAEPPAKRGKAASLEEALVGLLQTLKDDPHEERRAEAAERLAKADALKHFEVLPALIDTLTSDSSSQVRRAAARALGDLRPRTQEALDALRQAADEDASWRVRQVAKLAKWGYRPDAPKAGAPAASPQAGGPVTSEKKGSKLPAPPAGGNPPPPQENEPILAAPKLTLPPK